MATTPSLSRGNAFGIAKAFSSLAERFIEIVREWQQRSRSRRDLMALDERDLWDMHLTRCDASYEASKPFWRE
jgi:uncharacterized protein YjiS (DUF1127 family)